MAQEVNPFGYYKRRRKEQADKMAGVVESAGDIPEYESTYAGPSEAELLDIQEGYARAESDPEMGRGLGAGIGAVAGGILGGILGTAVVPGLGTGVGAGLGVTAGSALGGGIGSAIGGATASGAMSKAQSAEARAQKQAMEEAERREKYNAMVQNMQNKRAQQAMVLQMLSQRFGR